MVIRGAILEIFLSINTMLIETFNKCYATVTKVVAATATA